MSVNLALESPFSSPKGSLQALNLGMFSLDQLASLINWGNESDYKPPMCNPWVKIDLADGTADHNVGAASSAGKASATHDDSATEAAADATVRKAAMVATDPGELERTATVTQVAAEADDHRESAAELEHPVEPELSEQTEQDSPASEAAGDAELPTDSVASEQTADTRQASAVVSEVAAETQATDSLATAEHEQEMPSVSVAASTDPVPRRSDAHAPAVATSVSKSNRVAARTQPPVIMKQTPTNRPAMNDDYLQRLESLVLELNLQLARQTCDSEANDIDYTQWLSQRVIDLSLENMSLQEELQKLR